MTVEKLIEFLSVLPKDLDLHIMQPDIGGYDCEIVPLIQPVVFRFRDGQAYLADVSCETKCEKMF